MGEKCFARDADDGDGRMMKMVDRAEKVLIQTASALVKAAGFLLRLAHKVKGGDDTKTT
jgi:hypothetical protein